MGVRERGIGVRERRITAVAIAIAVLATALVLARPHDPGVRPAAGDPVAAAASPAPATTSGPDAEPAHANLFEQMAHDTLAGGSFCFLALDGDRPLAAISPDEPLIPASTQKIFVGAAALQVFGQDHRFATTVVSQTPPVNGIVHDLWIVGGGDPWLFTPEYAAHLRGRGPRWAAHHHTPLDALADRIVAAGVRHVRGNVLGDDARHDTRRTVPTWEDRYLTGGSITPLSALAVNRGYATPGSPTADPPAHAAAELRRLLQDRGVIVDGEIGPGIAPLGRVEIERIVSERLSVIVGGMLHASDNLAAEMLVREIGLARLGSPTTQAGTRATLEVLAAAGVDVSGVHMADGSGLDRTNRATCRALADTIGLAPAGLSLTELLPTAGHSGTLWRRMHNTPMHGTVRGKSGWIFDVVGLTGTLEMGSPIRFAMLQNGMAHPPGAARAAQERTLHLLAEHPTAP